jgi:hypothetical protein
MSSDYSRWQQQPTDWRSYTPPSASGAQKAGEIIGRKTAEAITLGSAWAGYKAYENYREAGYEFQESMWKGAVTARRWHTFGFLFAAWLVWSFAMGFGWYMAHVIMPTNYPEYTAAADLASNSVRSGALTANLIFYGVVSILVFGIQHNRIITGGMHRRTWLFHVFHVPYMLTLWCPSFFLYLILFVLPITWG